MRGSFYGWYLKCQSETQTLAVIPAVHQIGRQRACSIQVITNNSAQAVTFPAEAFHRTGKYISIGGNYFGRKGICLSIHTPELDITGKLSFGTLTPLKYDIMGPFALVPFMECRHSVWSMKHTVSGTVYINGQKYFFNRGCGYWEGDQGRSFPQKYIWTQCCFPNGSLMLSVADIPMAGTHFTGIIGSILWQGKQYRLATYLGAKLAEVQDGKVRIIQKDMELEAHLLQKTGHPLKAPTNGDMARTIHESASCEALYRFRKNGHTLFSFETRQASFEYEW